jgi:hypothetical protein
MLFKRGEYREKSALFVSENGMKSTLEVNLP